jgi:phage gp36-like protein
MPQLIDHFITDNDLIVLIKADQLEAIVRGNPINFWTCITFALAEMEGYLKARYDTAAIFEQRGETRNPMIVMLACDIAVYHCYSAVAMKNIPQLRQDRYDAAIAWLKDVAKGIITPNLPVPVIENVPQNNTLHFGGEKKKDNRF